MCLRGCVYGVFFFVVVIGGGGGLLDFYRKESRILQNEECSLKELTAIGNDKWTSLIPKKVELPIRSLVATKRRYMRVCPSVRRSVGPSDGP